MMPSFEADIILGGTDVEMLGPVWDMWTFLSHWVSRGRMSEHSHRTDDVWWRLSPA